MNEESPEVSQTLFKIKYEQKVTRSLERDNEILYFWKSSLGRCTYFIYHRTKQLQTHLLRILFCSSPKQTNEQKSLMLHDKWWGTCTQRSAFDLSFI